MSLWGDKNGSEESENERVTVKKEEKESGLNDVEALSANLQGQRDTPSASRSRSTGEQLKAKRLDVQLQGT